MLLLPLLVAISGTYRNPIWNQDFPDPYVVESGADFYAYATQRDDLGFQCLHSKDLVHWERLPDVFKPSWADDHYWAPEVHAWKGKWYLVYSARNRMTHKHDVAIAVGDSAHGPFHEWSKLVDGSTNNVGDIDATLYLDEKRPFLLYSAEDPRSIEIVPLSGDLSHTVGEPTMLLKPDRPIEKQITEAPTLVKRDDRYWLFYSTGWFQSNKRDACYQIWAASSPRLFGPYVKPPKPLITTKPEEVYSPGHQCILDLPTGESWILYHAWDNSAEPLYDQNRHGRTLRMDRLRWTQSGPTTTAPTTTPQPEPHILRHSSAKPLSAQK
jgi:beta-xylosidase